MAYTEITPVHYDIQFIKGNDWIREIDVVIDDEGTLMNFDGWTAQAQVRYSPKSNSAVIAEFSSYALTLTLTEGKIKLNLPKEEISDVLAATYWWDVKFTDSEGYERTLVKISKFEVLADVTV